MIITQKLIDSIENMIVAEFTIQDGYFYLEHQSCITYKHTKLQLPTHNKALKKVQQGITQCGLCGIELQGFVLVLLRKRNLSFRPYSYFQCDDPQEKYRVFLEPDHIVPRHEKGSNNISNIQLLCTICHKLKHQYESIITGMIEHQTLLSIYEKKRRNHEFRIVQ